ncbi:MAG: hypothetical protein V1792_19900 [Pseudomonadota bacterium]
MSEQKPKYGKPMLVDLQAGDIREASAVCRVGNSDAGTCTNGNNAFSGCVNGPSARTGCANGSQAGVMCRHGGGRV